WTPVSRACGRPAPRSGPRWRPSSADPRALAPGDTGAVPYDPTIYLGSAAHYRCGRPAYSPGLEGLLTRKAGLDGSGRLLDGGCGPGVLTVRLAHLFREAVGLDPDADMLAEGARAAGERGITNIRWARGLAEDLPAVAPGPYRMVTFGQSFHWTDEQRVAETVYDLLGARRRAGAHRPYGGGAAPAVSRPGRAADPARRDQGAGGEVSRDHPAGGPGRRPGADAPLRGRASADPVWRSAAVLRPGHSRPGAR